MQKHIACSVAAVVAFALGVGYLAHTANPYGVYLYTPGDWCEGKRSNAFALVYAAVTGTAAALALVVAVILGFYAHLTSHSGGVGRADAAMGALKVGVLLGVLGVLGVLEVPIQSLFPLEVEPKCLKRIPSAPTYPQPSSS